MIEAVSTQTASIGLRQFTLLTFSVSAMANTDDTVSMVGAPPRRTQNIDDYSWGRTALDFTGVTVEQHDKLAEHMVAVAAAEVLLLIISQKCETGKRKWQEAKDLGIPWLNKVGGPW